MEHVYYHTYQNNKGADQGVWAVLRLCCSRAQAWFSRIEAHMQTKPCKSVFAVLSAHSLLAV